MKWGEANRLRLSLSCGAPGARLLLTRDGRNVRLCSQCYGLPHLESMWGGSVDRSPIEEEERVVPGAHAAAP